jgi:uncharacterized protein YgbK (DUF1537 family)
MCAVAHQGLHEKAGGRALSASDVMIGVIADDITGAAEMGAIGLRYGLRAEVVVHGEVGSGPDLVCVDTDSRSCTAEEAARRAAAASDDLKAAGAAWIYKKVDSVLRGQVVAEVESIRKQLGASRALLAPANPRLGRTILDGEYFVRSVPLHETDFRLDPEHPRLDSRVKGLLDAGSSIDVGICRLSDPMPSSGIIVAEAQSAEDVSRWAGRLDASTLAAGAAEFFAALLLAKGYAPLLASKMDFNPKPAVEFFVCGSVSESTRAFLAGSRESRVPVFGLPTELASGNELSASERDQLADQITNALGLSARVVLEVGLPPLDRSVARRMPGCLAEVAQAVFSRMRSARVYAEGGATAASLVRRAGWKRLKISRELAPGVVTTEVEGDPRWLFTVKPGSYTWPGQLIN